MTVTRRYPFGPLAAAMGLSPNQACKALGLGGASQKEYRRIGMSEYVADRLAVKMGLHPFTVWPEMADDHVADLRRRKAEDERRRYHQSPEKRAKQLAAKAAYYAAYGHHKRRQLREQYWDNPEEARRRLRDRPRSNRQGQGQMTENVGREDDDGGRGVQDDGERRLQGRHEDQIVKNVGESGRADVAS